MSPRATMRPHVLSLVLLLAVSATVPLASAVCIARHEKPESKSEEATASTTTLSLGEHGTPKKLYEMPKKKDPYGEATTAKASAAYEKPVGEAEAASFSPPGANIDDPHISAYLEKGKKENFVDDFAKTDDSDVSAYLNKEKKEKFDDFDNKETKEKSDDSDVSAYLKKEKKDKSDDLDELASHKKKKKDKSDDSDVSAYLKKQKKKSDDSDKKEEKSDDLDELASPKKKKKVKSDDSDESSSSSKKKKKEKSDESDKNASPKKEKNSDASAYLKKEKKEKAKKKEKSNEYSEDKEKSDEDAMPVDVSSSGKYVSSPKEEKSDEDAAPVDVSASGQYVSSPKNNVPNELPPTAKSSTISDAYSNQPIGGGSPDELPQTAKSSTTSDAYSNEPIGGGAPDELPPAAKKSSDPYATAQPNMPGKPKLSTETFGGMIKKPLLTTLSPAVKRVCDQTSFPDDCEESIAELPGGGSVPPQTDAIGVLRLAMQAVRQKAIEALNSATDRMNLPAVDPTIKEVLDTCTSSYSDIRSSIDSVEAALKRNDLDSARTYLDSVETDVGTCEDGFAERETPSVMSDHDDELKKLSMDLVAIGANFFRH